MNWKGCAGCGDVVLESEAVTSTRRIGESDGVEYRCYECDPWAEVTPSTVTSPLAEPLTELFDEIGAMMEGRHAKYGPGNIAEFGDLGILVRMGDKFARLKSGFQDFGDETVHDTLDDIIGYALIWKMWLNGDWPGSNSSGSVTMATKPRGTR